jgi:hypothetical protein
MTKRRPSRAAARAHASTRVLFSCSKQKGLRPFESLCEKSFTKGVGGSAPRTPGTHKLSCEKLRMESKLQQKGLRPFESLCEKGLQKESGAPPPAPPK